MCRSRIEALNEPYKLEILDSIKTEPITIYHVGDQWWDLCAGPHVESTGQLNSRAIELQSLAGAYWRGDEKNAMLQVAGMIISESPLSASLLTSFCRTFRVVVADIRDCLGDSGAAEVVQAEDGGGQEKRSPHTRPCFEAFFNTGGCGWRSGVLASQGCGGAEASRGLLEGGTHQGRCSLCLVSLSLSLSSLIDRHHAIIML